MKRLLPAVAMLLLLASCASPLTTRSETPQQALAATSQTMSQLHSAKFTLHGNVAITLPAQLAQAFSQLGGSSMGITNGTLTVSLTGTGEAQLPDRFHAAITAAMGTITVKTEEIVIAGKVYLKNPSTGSWTVLQGSAGLSDQLNQPDPLTYTQVLDAAKSVTDLGDGTLDGVTVHHYQVVLDPQKLSSKLSTLPAMKNNPQAQATFTQMLQHGTMTMEVWFGKDDHRLRQIHAVSVINMDLGQVMGALSGRGSQGTSGSSGTTTKVTTTFDITYHDFNAPVTVTAPSIG